MVLVHFWGFVEFDGTGKQQAPLSFLGSALLDQALAHAAPGGVSNLCSTTSSRSTNWEPSTAPAVIIRAFGLLAALDPTPVPQRTTAKGMTFQHVSRFVQIFKKNSCKWPITWLTPNQAASYMTGTTMLTTGLWPLVWSRSFCQFTSNRENRMTDGRMSSSSTPGGAWRFVHRRLWSMRTWVEVLRCIQAGASWFPTPLLGCFSLIWRALITVRLMPLMPLCALQWSSYGWIQAIITLLECHGSLSEQWRLHR